MHGTLREKGKIPENSQKNPGTNHATKDRTLFLHIFSFLNSKTPKLQTPNPKLQTPNPKPGTSNLKTLDPQTNMDVYAPTPFDLDQLADYASQFEIYFDVEESKIRDDYADELLDNAPDLEQKKWILAVMITYNLVSFSTLMGLLVGRWKVLGSIAKTLFQAKYTDEGMVLAYMDEDPFAVQGLCFYKKKFLGWV